MDHESDLNEMGSPQRTNRRRMFSRGLGLAGVAALAGVHPTRAADIPPPGVIGVDRAAIIGHLGHCPLSV